MTLQKTILDAKNASKQNTLALDELENDRIGHAAQVTSDRSIEQLYMVICLCVTTAHCRRPEFQCGMFYKNESEKDYHSKRFLCMYRYVHTEH